MSYAHALEWVGTHPGEIIYVGLILLAVAFVCGAVVEFWTYWRDREIAKVSPPKAAGLQHRKIS
jgi:hypothetical protein